MPFGAAMGALIAGSVSSATPVKAPANNFVSFRITSCSLGLLDARGRYGVEPLFRLMRSIASLTVLTASRNPISYSFCIASNFWRTLGFASLGKGDHNEVADGSLLHDGGDEAAIAKGKYRAGAPPMLDPDQMRA